MLIIEILFACCVQILLNILEIWNKLCHISLYKSLWHLTRVTPIAPVQRFGITIWRQILRRAPQYHPLRIPNEKTTAPMYRLSSTDPAILTPFLTHQNSLNWRSLQWKLINCVINNRKIWLELMVILSCPPQLHQDDLEDMQHLDMLGVSLEDDEQNKTYS